MSNEITTIRDGDVPAIADDFLIAIADQAERRIDAVIKIKKVALKVTNARDWTDQNGNPYLQVSGSEKIANLFNISWRISEPLYEEEPDGHFMYSIKGEFSLGGRTIEVEGTRSSKDLFFNRYDYSKPKGPDGKHPTLPPSSIDKGDVKKAALTNLYGNGITRILGIRNLTWSDLEEYAGIKQADCGQVNYKAKSGKPAVSQPTAKSKLTDTQAACFPRIKAALDTLHGADIEAKKETLKRESTIPAKGDYPEKEGVEDYRTLDGKRLEILADKLETLAKKKVDTQEDKEDTLPIIDVCQNCGERINEDGTGHLEGCSNEVV